MPKGYAPITYEELARMTGMSITEVRAGADEMRRSGVLDFIQVGNMLFYKLNIGKDGETCLM